MKLSNKQKNALEKITGKAWNSWHPEAIDAYFAFTDRGLNIEVSKESKTDFDNIMKHHHWHSVIVEMWKIDFKKGLLFLWDFLSDNLPKAYTSHAFEIYQSVMDYIPRCYRQHKNCPTIYKEI